MTTHAIFVAAAADGWQGPDISTWDSGLVQDGDLVLKHATEEERLLGCALKEVEIVRFCRLPTEAGTSCVQIDVSIRGIGKLIAYASDACLVHIEGQGVATEEMGARDKAVFEPLWQRLTLENEAFTTEIVALVNERLQ